MSLELILEDIELSDNTINDNTFDVYFDEATGEILAIENFPNGRTLKYKLKGDQDEISRLHRAEILDYNLAKVLPSDEVSLRDIFMHGEYVEKIN